MSLITVDPIIADAENKEPCTAHQSSPNVEKDAANESDQIQTTLRNPSGDDVTQITGWSFFLLFFILGVAIFLVTIEVSIVATSLQSITKDFDASNMTSWIVTAYLLTYTGFLIIIAKSSDIFGRKIAVIISLLVFTAFSGACGGSQNITQLIVLRTFQGIGASGSYSVIVAIFFELVTPAQFARTTSFISSIFALAFLSGPLFGGAITQFSTWRWVFLLNVPAGSLCVVGLAILLPSGFPHQRQSICELPTWRSKISKSQLSRLDLVGTVLLLCASVFLVTGLGQAGNPYPWDSAIIIICLSFSIISWICFFTWSKWATGRESSREPVFPWRLVQNRFSIGLLITIFLTGMPFTIAVIQIPLRFQALNGLTPLEAGIRLLPYAVLNPLGSVVAPYIAKRFQLPPLYIILIGAIFQVIGTALLSISPASEEITAAIYVYEGLAGFGAGVNLACLIVMTPFNVEKKDKAVAMSAMVQSRMLGGALGLAIVTAAFTTAIRSDLVAASFTPAEIESLLKSSNILLELPSGKMTHVRSIFSNGYNLQMKLAAGFSAAQILASLLLWRHEQFVIPKA